MALFHKDRDRTESPPQGFGVTSPRPTESPTAQFLSQGSRLVGKVLFEGTVRIEGHVEGEISAQDTLIVGESAEVKAQISGTSVVVHGRVTGDVTARQQLEIQATGSVIGNVIVKATAVLGT